MSQECDRAERGAGGVRLHVVADPRGQCRLADRVICDAYHEMDDVGLRGRQTESVQPQEHKHQLKGCPLITVDKSMILREAESVRRREIGEIGRWVIRPEMLWTRERGLNKTVITNAMRSAELAHEIDMIGVSHEPRDPSRLRPSRIVVPRTLARPADHLPANSRYAFRYIRIPSSAMAIASRNVGS